MRVLVFGVMKMAGKSAKTGSMYSMARVYVASDIQSKKTDAYDRVGAGYEAAEVDLDETAIGQFVGLSYPCVLTLDTSMRMQGGRLVPVVVGIIPDKTRAAA